MANIKLSVKEMLNKMIGKQKDDGLTVVGRCHHEARHADGTKFIDVWCKNTITNAGLAVITGLVGNVDSQTAFGYLAIGSDDTPASASQTALGSEITTNGGARAAATISRENGNATDDKLRFTKTWNISGSITVEEIGIFNHSSTGTMLARHLTGTLELGNGDTYQATYDITFAGA